MMHEGRKGTVVTSSEAGVEDDRFWSNHLVAGLAMYVAGSGAGAVYLLVTPDRDHRTALWVAVAAGFASTVLVVLLPRRAILASARRELFFVAWSEMTCVFTSIVALIDGGLASPLAFLLFLPLSYAALAYPPPAVALITATAVVAATLVGVVAGDAAGRIIVFAGTLLMAGTLAIFAARQRRAQAAGLVDLATHDGLTGCLNHRAFYDRMDIELVRARRLGRDLALLMIDIDRFKTVNDRHGHLTGDEVLRRVGAALRAATREIDVVGRVGGDEFAALLVESSAEAARAVAARIAAQVATADMPVDAQVSIGVAHAEGGATTVTELVSAADRALYESKSRG